MVGLVLAVVVAVAPPAAAANPYATEQAAALADARKLDPVTAALTRYLSFAQVPAELRGDARRVVNLWANNLSREAEFYRPRRVTETVFAVNVLDYGWDPQTWEKLADEDPYYHVQVTFQAGTQGKRYFPAEKSYKAGWYLADFKVTKTVAAIAPWLPAADAAELVARCQSAAPIVRADWWFSRAAIQAGRKGTGYYDWLQVKDLKTFDSLIGFDRKKSQDVKREVGGIVVRSGVSNFSRQVFREQSITGGRWETRDVLDDNKDARNAGRQLDRDFKPQAFETYGRLPNDLYAYGLFDDKGATQETAPDRIGADKTAPGNDPRIHVGLSCQRCHVEGLRPVADRARQRYSGPVRLNVADPVEARRLHQLYLGELQGRLDEDNASYAKALKTGFGWKPDEAAKAVGALWAWYQEADLLPADLAAEFGVLEADYLAKLRAYYKANQLSDPVLADHLANPPLPIRRDDVEQLYAIVAPVILGAQK